MTHICVVELSHHWFRWWLVAYSAPSHYLNQCWNIVNWTSRNNLQWNFNRNLTFTFKKFHLETSSAKWRQFCLGLNELTAAADRNCIGVMTACSSEHISAIRLLYSVHTFNRCPLMRVAWPGRLSQVATQHPWPGDATRLTYTSGST